MLNYWSEEPKTTTTGDSWKEWKTNDGGQMKGHTGEHWEINDSQTPRLRETDEYMSRIPAVTQEQTPPKRELWIHDRNWGKSHVDSWRIPANDWLLVGETVIHTTQMANEFSPRCASQQPKKKTTNSWPSCVKSRISVDSISLNPLSKLPMLPPIWEGLPEGIPS